MRVNEIIKINDTEWRVVHIFESNALMIKMKGQSVDLQSFDMNELDAMVRNGTGTIELDPWADVAFRTGNDAMKEKAKRDYDRIHPLLRNPEIYSDMGRRRLIRELCGGDAAEMRRVKLLLGTFWRRGQHMLSLMPDYGKNVGHVETGKKRGKKAKEGGEIGAEPTPELIAAMDAAARNFVEAPDGRTLKAVYEDFVQRWVSGEIQSEATNDSAPETTEEKRMAPTYYQFYYYYRTRYGTRSGNKKNTNE